MGVPVLRQPDYEETRGRGATELALIVPVLQPQQ